MKEEDLMRSFAKLIASVGLALTLAACAGANSEGPSITSSQAESPDQRLSIYSIYVVEGGDQQLMSMIYDNLTAAWEMKMASENTTFGRSLAERVVSAVGPAAVSGLAGIAIAREGSCSADCGTVFFNDGRSASFSVSGSQSEAAANAAAAIEGARR